MLFIPMEKNGFLDVRSPYVALYTTLGCPYQCHFCMTNGIFGGPGSRGWSAPVVLSWIDELYNKYKVTVFHQLILIL